MKQDTVHMTPDTSLENDDTELFIQIASCLFSTVHKSVRMCVLVCPNAEQSVTFVFSRKDIL